MINWFPGHMLTAGRQIGQVLKRVDCVIEVRDARLPFSSSSSQLRDTLPPSMPVVVALNKSDLANPNLSVRAMQLIDPHRSVLTVSAGPLRGRGVSHLLPTCIRAAANRRSVGPLHIVVVGVPNAGKSSLINALRGGHAAKTGPTPGLTRNIGTFAVKIPGAEPVYVVDSPGVLAPAGKISPEDGKRLAIAGCVKDTAVPNSLVHEWLLEELRSRGRDVSKLTLDYVLQHSGGALDEESASLAVLNRFRSGELGKFTLDRF